MMQILKCELLILKLKAFTTHSILSLAVLLVATRLFKYFLYPCVLFEVDWQWEGLKIVIG